MLVSDMGSKIIFPSQPKSVQDTTPEDNFGRKAFSHAGRMKKELLKKKNIGSLGIANPSPIKECQIIEEIAAQKTLKKNVLKLFFDDVNFG